MDSIDTSGKRADSRRNAETEIEGYRQEIARTRGGAYADKHAAGA